MNPEDTELVHRLRTGICPHTGKKYDCAHCEWEQEEPPPLKPGMRRIYSIGLNMCITGYVEDDTPMREWNRLAGAFTGVASGKDLRQYFFALYSLGVQKIPIGDGEIEDFCFRQGWLRHYRDVEDCDK